MYTQWWRKPSYTQLVKMNIKRHLYTDSRLVSLHSSSLHTVKVPSGTWIFGTCVEDVKEVNTWSWTSLDTKYVYFRYRIPYLLGSTDLLMYFVRRTMGLCMWSLTIYFPFI